VASFAGALCGLVRNARCVDLAAALGCACALRCDAMQPRGMRRVRRRSGARQQSEGEYQGRNVRVSCLTRDAGNGGERSLSEHDVIHKGGREAAELSQTIC